MDFLKRRIGIPVWAIALAVLILPTLGAAGAGSGDDEDNQTTASTTSSTVTATTPERFRTTTTVATTTTTTAPTTTIPPTTTTTEAERPREVARFSGASDKQTASFVVDGQWDLAWAITGGAGVGIEVKTEAGGRVGYYSTDPGEDRTIIRGGCTCYLDISPFGSSYTIVVTELPG